MGDERPIIVGGGIAGLTAGLLLSKQGQRPVIVEAKSNWGGLLHSNHRPPYGAFDVGSHVISETGSAVLDRHLFSHLDESDYCIHEKLSNGTYFNGRSSDSGFIDTRSLDEGTYKRSIDEFFKTQPKKIDFDDTALNVAQQRYGKGFAEHIVAPVLKRFFGSEVDDLNSRALHLTGLRRLLVGSEEEALRWKSESSWNDERMCFHSVKPGNQGLRHYYPKKGGMGTWVSDIVTELSKAGVDLLSEARIDRCSVSDGKVLKVILTDGRELPCKQLIWCAPVYPLFGLSGIRPPEGLDPPRLCAMALTDMVLNRPPLTEHTYVTCHDRRFKTFRVTNYQALEGGHGEDSSGCYRLTIEEMRPFSSQRTPSDVASLFKELCALGVADPQSDVVFSWQDSISNGFPLPTNRFVSNSFVMAQKALNSIHNLKIMGRGSGRVFFTSEVLIDVYNQLSEL